MNTHNLEYLDPAEIKLRKNAWRIYSREQIKAAGRLIEKAGGVAFPPVIDKDGHVAWGEEFVLAARELKLKSIPVIRAEGFSPEWLRLYAANAQKMIDMGAYDEALFAKELRELEELLGADTLTDLAIEEGELTRLLGLDSDIVENTESEEQSDQRVITVLGELWTVGDHRILCADCLEASSYDALMQGELATFGLTDPPYNLSVRDISSDPDKEEFAYGFGEMSPNEFTRFCTRYMSLMKEHSVPGSLHAFSMSYHFLGELFRAGTIVYGRPKTMATWVKPHPGQGSFLRSQTEHFTYFKHGDAPHRNNVMLGKHGRNRSTAWHYDGMTTPGAERDELLKLHATPKPTNLLKDAILDVTARGDIVLDPFAGIGSIALAAQSAERRAYMIEIEPRFVDAAIRRLRKTYGLEAYRESDGAAFSDLERALETETAS